MKPTHLCDALYAEYSPYHRSLDGENGSLFLLDQYDETTGKAEQVLVLDPLRLKKLLEYLEHKGLLRICER